jgi:hypothetical protein
LKTIIFTNTLQNNYYEPKPASKCLPEWYCNTESYIKNNKNASDPANTTSTIKKCLPVFDSLTAGYILFTQVDIWVSQIEGGQDYTWSAQNALNFHDKKQVNLYPNFVEQNPIPKFMNPYIVETPIGWSSLFVPPMHNPNPYFTILPAIVDTDKHKSCVNFVFKLNSSDYEGLIPAGTPMAQVIPIKRNNWKMKKGGEKEMNENINIINKINTKFFDRYKTFFWTRKSYR